MTGPAGACPCTGHEKSKSARIISRGKPKNRIEHDSGGGLCAESSREGSMCGPQRESMMSGRGRVMPGLTMC